MSPFNCASSTFKYANNFYLNNGELYRLPVNNTSLSIVPVINLTPEYVSQMTGDGTIGNEYHVE